MYKFIKYKTTHNGETFISDWCFEPQSMDDVLEFSLKYTKGLATTEFGNMCQYLIKNFNQESYDKYGINTKWIFNNEHPTSPYGIGIDFVMNTMGLPLMVASEKLMKDTMDGRINAWNSGMRCFYPNDGFRCIRFDDRFSEVCDEIFNDSIVFPDIDRPSIEDVKFMVWDGGKHWYAKIGKMDVVVDGQQKWNTKNDAIEASKKFIEANWK